MREKQIKIVGIGASAGGLEALELFFKGLPDNTGLAFVVIQHLSPDYKSLMDELLARYTHMPILVAQTGMTLEPNKVYLIPPSKNLSVFHNQLYLEDQDNQKHLNLPIDVFFRSLALDAGHEAVAIVLSGTGSDGTNGCKRIKETDGLVMVQDPKSAKFDGMPKSCIANVLVDFILPPEDMGEELLSYLEAPFSSPQKGPLNGSSTDQFTKIAMIIRDKFGVDFTSYKESTMFRRLERRLRVTKSDSLGDYIHLLRDSDQEKEILFREMLIGVTSFFRDPEAYQVLEKVFLPQIKADQEVVRVWSAGCSTGEEAYSLAILLYEYRKKTGGHWDLKVFATDIDPRALQIAGEGYYPGSLLAEMDPHLRNTYFIQRDDGFQVCEVIRKCIVFARHNVLNDPPFSRLDLLVCRNLFIYIKPKEQQRIINDFSYALQQKGYLWLGSAESVGALEEMLEVVDSKWRLFRFKEDYQHKTPSLKTKLSDSSLLQVSDKNVKPPLFRRKTQVLEKMLSEALAMHLPPSVIIDSNDDLIHIIGEANAFIQTQPGRFSASYSSNMPRELALYVGTCLRGLRKGAANVSMKNLSISGYPGTVTINAKSLSLEGDSAFLVSFQSNQVNPESDQPLDIEPSSEAHHRIRELEMDLQSSQEGLQATIEELESSNEELQSANEELITSNEELQSTNEELQSVNEELYTVNAEHQQKIEELNEMTSDLANLLTNTEVGALYLDDNLLIRKVTPLMSQVMNILEVDIGRPLGHLSGIQRYPEMVEDIQNVAETLETIEKQIYLDDKSSWFIRIRPYRTENYAVNGVILTLVDISGAVNGRFSK